jgi:hypothetical protein
MGSPPNRTADRARRSTALHAAAGGIAPEIASLSLRVADAQAAGSSRRRPTLVRARSADYAEARCPSAGRSRSVTSGGSDCRGRSDAGTSVLAGTLVCRTRGGARLGVERLGSSGFASLLRRHQLEPPEVVLDRHHLAVREAGIVGVAADRVLAHHGAGFPRRSRGPFPQQRRRAGRQARANYSLTRLAATRRSGLCPSPGDLLRSALPNRRVRDSSPPGGTPRWRSR